MVALVSALSKVTDLILSVLNSAGTGNGKQMEDGLFLLKCFNRPIRFRRLLLQQLSRGSPQLRCRLFYPVAICAIFFSPPAN